MATIEVEEDERRKLHAAVARMYDYHHGKGNTGAAKEYRELLEKVSEAKE